MKKSLATAKIAIYYDWLNYQYGGAERVLLNLIKIFPKAEIFTLFYDPQKTKWLPKNIKIHTSFLQNFPKTFLLSPLYDIAAESLNFKNFDIIISTTSNVGHSLLTPASSLLICYYHNLNRHLYLNPQKILLPLLNFYKKIDKIYSYRPDISLCNSKTTQDRLLKHLNLNSEIINPGIDTKFFTPILNSTNDYFLIVSRLVPHKSIDYVIKTFINLDKKLIIVGTGRDQARLKSIANNSSNIVFTNQINNNELLNYYQNCKALICPQIEDFGLSPLEAQSCGKPVIALNKGGITQTVLNKKTGIFFNYQTEKSLKIAINIFLKTKFDPQFIRQHALSFDHSIFMLNFKNKVNTLWQQHQK